MRAVKGIPRRMVSSGRPGETVPWGAIRPLGPLVPASGVGAVRFPTEVRVAFDGRSLLVRFECLDPDPWSTLRARDADLWTEEVVELFVAPGEGDPASYAEIEVNPAGAVFDAWVDNPEGDRRTMRVDRSWDLDGLEALAGVGGAGWWVELTVPLAPIAQRSGVPVGDTWRANFYRIDRPRDGAPAEFSCWSPTRTEPADFHVPGRFGFLGVKS